MGNIAYLINDTFKNRLYGVIHKDMYLERVVKQQLSKDFQNKTSPRHSYVKKLAPFVTGKFKRPKAFH